MKSRIGIFSMIFLCAAFAAQSLYAQEDRIPEFDPNREIRYEAAPEPQPDTDSKLGKPVIQARDSVYVRPAQKKTDGKPNENASVLGFNFLYYLIERFKLSDIVD